MEENLKGGLEEKGKIRGLSSNVLKLIAIIAMTIDHIAWLVWPGCQHSIPVMGMHLIGRITAPIMWFFIAEGFHYTRNVKKYAGRLFLFAFISHFAYNLAGGLSLIPDGFFNQTSVMWSLAWSVVIMAVYENQKYPVWAKLIFTAFVCFITFPADWSCIAVMCPVFIHSHRGNFRKQSLDIFIWTVIYAAVYFFTMDRVYGLLQFGTLLSLPVLAFYNGQRGKCRNMKWFFYIYYPAHLFIIALIRILSGTGRCFP